MRAPVLLLQALLDVFAPLRCVLCRAALTSSTAVTPGSPVRGLRPWDEVPLCRTCQISWPAPRCADARDLRVWAATCTDPRTAKLVHAWKYHGQRGLGWPLAQAVAAAAQPAALPARCRLVPVPLHRRRRRARGFDQADLLARLVAAALNRPCAGDIVRRVQATSQQARLDDATARERNVSGAFSARAPEAGEAPGPLVIVDDVVTSGATIGAAAAAARRAGWSVAGVLAVATSLPSAAPVDTSRAGS